MNCQYDERIIHLYIDNELSNAARARVQEHLSICDNCRAKFNAVKTIRQDIVSCCANTQTPVYLKSRILANLDTIESDNSEPIGFLDRFRLMIINLKTSRAVAMGLGFGLVMLMVLFPGRQGFGHITGDLAKAHIEYTDGINPVSIISGSSDTIETFISDYLGIEARVPESFPCGLKLTGVCIHEINGIQTAHAHYLCKGEKCSLYIYHNLQLSNRSKYTLCASGREYEIGSCSDINFICWHEEQVSYILCGCCCFNKLTQLASFSD